MFSLSLLPAALLGPFVLSVYFLLAYVNWRLAVRRRRRRNSRVSAFVGRRTELNAPPQQRLAIDLEKNKNDGLEFDSRLSLEMTLSPDLSVSGCCGRPDVGWTWDVVASPDGTGQLFIRSHLVGHPLLSYEIGAGGCVNRITDLVRNVELVPPAVNPLVQNDRMGTMLVTWSNGLAVSVPHLADQRWNMNMGGSRDELAPVIAVTLGEGYLDVFTLLRDQFSPLLKDRMKTLVAGRIRYKMKQNSPVLEIQRTLVFGETIVDGRERKLTGMYLENWCCSSNKSFTTLSMSIDASGNLGSSLPIDKVPYYPGTPASQTNGYAILSSPNGPALAYISDRSSNMVFNTMAFNTGTATCFAANFPAIEKGDVVDTSLFVVCVPKVVGELHEILKEYQPMVPASTINAKGVEAGLVDRLKGILEGKEGSGTRTAGLAPLLKRA